MSDRYDNDENFDDDDNSPAGLRAALKKAKAEAKKAEERATAAEQRAATAEKTAKKSTLADLLKEAGIDPKFAARADKDGADATADGVKAWVDENKDFYNFEPKAPVKDATADDEVVEDAGDEDVIPDELAEALAASARLDQSGVSPSQVGTMQRLAGLNTDPRKVSYEDVVKQLADMGAPID